MSYFDEKTSRFVDLTYDQLKNTIKLVAKRMKLNPAHFAVHSPRIGGASTLRAGQKPDGSIQLLGRWRCARSTQIYQAGNVTEFIEMQRTLALSVHFSSEIVRLLSVNAPQETDGLDLTAEGVE